MLEFRPIITKAVSKGNEITEITLKVANNSLKGKKDLLDAFIEKPIQITVIHNTVEVVKQIDPVTNQPTIIYDVDDHGVVSEIKRQNEHLDLGADSVEMIEESYEVDVETVEEFIIDGQFPELDDSKFDIQEIILLMRAGKSKEEIAEKLNSNTTDIELFVLDEYQRLAPYAAVWKDWKEAQ